MPILSAPTMLPQSPIATYHLPETTAHPHTEHLGQHLVVEFLGCPSETLQCPTTLQAQMTQAAEASKATVVATSFTANAYQGISGVLVLAESHFIIHTRPEEGYAALDLYTCGSHTEPNIGLTMLQEVLQPAQVTCSRYHRGFIDTQHQAPMPQAPQQQAQAFPW